MENANRYEDPLGFTKQTAVMLLGLNADDLIPQFKKRNISTQDLPKLTKTDLKTLGADEDRADKIFKQFQSTGRKLDSESFWRERKTQDLIKILEAGNNQLNLIEIAIAYMNLKMAQNSEDFTIDTTKNLRASQALCFAIEHTIQDIEELEKKFQELASLIKGEEEKKINNSTFLRLVVRVGVTAGALCILKYALASLKKS